MALVAYDNSDSSEYEDEESENLTIGTLVKKNEETSIQTNVETTSSSRATQDETESPSSGPSLFNLLPQPSSKKPSVIEEDDEFLHKKESTANLIKPKAKIIVPSLSDFKDVEDKPAVKPKAANGKKSGLLSMLPQPRNAVTATTKSLIPNVLTQMSKPTAKKKVPIPSLAKKAKTATKALIDSDESDNDDEMQNDFFSINKPIDLPVDDVPLDIDKDLSKPDTILNKQRPNIQSYFKPEPTQIEADYDMEEPHLTENVAGSSSNDHETLEYGDANVVLDEEAIMKLCGARGKRRREDIQIVDVNQQEVLAEAKEMFQRGLLEDTSKRTSSSKKKGNEPTTQQRRKHQITYLAHQAKANEAELQSQWANSRMSRRQTQSKYGF